MFSYSALVKGTLWILRYMPFRQLHHRIAYRGCIGRNVSIGRGALIIGEKVRIGSNVKIGRDVVIFAKEVDIADEVCIDAGAKVECNRFSIDTGSWIWERCALQGISFHKSSVVIGKFSWIFSDCYLDTTYGIEIGDFVCVGGRSTIWTHGSWQSILDGFPAKFAPAVIKKNVYLGWHTVVLSGVTIGQYATIGAGSVVTKDIPQRCLAVGGPARIIKDSSVYPQSVSAKEKCRIVRSILNEYASAMRSSFNVKRFLKNKRVQTEKDHQGNITVISGREKLNIHIQNDRITAASDLAAFGDRGKTVLIAVKGIDEQMRPALDTFFGFVDLDCYIYSFKGVPDIVRELIDTFWCYGISIVHERHKAYARGRLPEILENGKGKSDA